MLMNHYETCGICHTAGPCEHNQKKQQEEIDAALAAHNEKADPRKVKVGKRAAGSRTVKLQSTALRVNQTEAEELAARGVKLGKRAR